MPSALTTEERLAVLETQVANVTASQREIHEDVKKILAQVNRWRGMAAMLLMVGGAAGAVGGFFAKVKEWI